MAFASWKVGELPIDPNGIPSAPLEMGECATPNRTLKRIRVIGRHVAPQSSVSHRTFKRLVVLCGHLITASF